MNVTLTYNGVVDIRKYERGTVLEVAEGTTPADIMNMCEIRDVHQKYILPFVNGVEVKTGTILEDGDEISLFLPLGGG